MPDAMPRLSCLYGVDFQRHDYAHSKEKERSEGYLCGFFFAFLCICLGAMSSDRTFDCFIILSDHKSKFFSNPSIFVYRTSSICLSAPNRRRSYVCALMSALLCLRSYVCALMSALLCLRSYVGALLSGALLTGHRIFGYMHTHAYIG